MLLVGGGGAYFATTAADGSASAGGRTTSGAPGDGTPPPLALDGYSEGGGGTNGIAPGEPNPYGVTYRADGTLPDGPGSAPVYRTQGQVSEGEVAALARALGVDGKPVAAGQAWTVGAKDSMGPSLQVNRQAPGTWTFHRYSPGTDNCQGATTCAKPPADASGDPVSEAVAKKAAAPVLKAAGQDDTKLDASRTLGAQRIVNAEPVVGDLPTYGWTTGVTVDAQGQVLSGNGQLKPPVKGDTYPVLNAKETLALLNAAPGSGHRMGIGGCATPVPMKDRLEAPCGSSTATPAKETLTVDKAVFGLAPHTVDGRQALVPSWLFDVRAAGAQNDFTVTYPAVDPEYVTSPTLSAQPSEPSAPGDQPTAAPAPRNVQVDGYTAEGRELTVSFTGGVCADYKVTVSEGGNEVTVKVTETRWPDKVCIMIAKEFQKTVQLDEPLGDRAVVARTARGFRCRRRGHDCRRRPERGDPEDVRDGMRRPRPGHARRRRPCRRGSPPSRCSLPVGIS
ncbi:Large membrane protein OS=Streptomyces alboniger OX=132473 GN=CP975_09495 PE=4 SV=1 [Streptomyces alboniger]